MIKIQSRWTKDLTWAMLLIVFMQYHPIKDKYPTIFIVFIFFIILFIVISNFFFKGREFVVLEDDILKINLDRFEGEYNIMDITSLTLYPNENFLYIETANQKCVHKLYWFKRSKIEEIIETIKKKNKNII